MTMASPITTLPPPPIAEILALIERLRHRKDRPITSLNGLHRDLRLARLFLHYLAALLMISRRQGQSEPDKRLEDVLREYERIKSED
jgi:hypothetical protein